MPSTLCISILSYHLLPEIGPCDLHVTRCPLSQASGLDQSCQKDPHLVLQEFSRCRSQDDSLSASELTAQHDSKAEHAAAPTAEALGSVMCLLEACLSNRHMPTPEEAVTEAQNDGESHLLCTRPQEHLPK